MENSQIKIQVLGAGCPTCKQLYDLTVEAITELKLGIEVEYITEVKKLIELGVIQGPVLTIDSNPVTVGFVPSKEEIKQIITGYISAKAGVVQKSGGCSCGGNCG